MHRPNSRGRCRDAISYRDRPRDGNRRRGTRSFSLIVIWTCAPCRRFIEVERRSPPPPHPHVDDESTPGTRSIRTVRSDDPLGAHQRRTDVRYRRSVYPEALVGSTSVDVASHLECAPWHFRRGWRGRARVSSRRSPTIDERVGGSVLGESSDTGATHVGARRADVSSCRDSLFAERFAGRDRDRSRRRSAFRCAQPRLIGKILIAPWAGRR